jgi:hypothetical protein
MSETGTKTKKAPTPKDDPISSGTQLINVIKAMGPWHGYNGLPGHGHRWMLARHIKVSPTCWVMWAWLFEHTLMAGCAEHSEEYGQRSPYAVIRQKDGMIEAHLEHMAADLDIEIRNARAYWDEGAEAEIWEHGEGKEGTRRMCLRTEVKKAPKKVAEGSEIRVCTYPWEKLPPYVSSHIQTLPPEEQKKFWDRHEVSESTAKLLHAEAVAAVREVTDQDQDTLFHDFGAEKMRLTQKKNGADPVYLKARAERVAALRATLEGYVHTLKDYVQSDSSTRYKVEDIPQNGDASLLPVDSPQKVIDLAGRQSLSTQQSRREPLPDDGKNPVKLVPVPPTPEPAPAKLTKPEIALFAELANWKNDYQHVDFGAEEISRQNKGHVATVRRIVEIVKGDVAGFVPYAAEKLEDLRPALGKRPGNHGPGGRALGLVLEWAGDFVRGAAERARKEKQKQEAFAAAAENAKALAAELDQAEALRHRGEEIWESLTPPDRSARVAKLLSDFKKRFPNLSPAQLTTATEMAAKNEFVGEYVGKVSQSGMAKGAY